VTDRHEHLRSARLYLVCDEQPDEFLATVLGAGVDIVQLRMKDAGDDAIVAAGQRFARAAARHRALFMLNDRPDLVAAAGADGVHVGQDDVSAEQARELLGPDAIVGLSTHSEEQIAASEGRPVDYISVGPIWETPTKEGRPGVGLELIAHAAERCPHPFFAIGGIDAGNAGEVVAAGAERLCVVRAIRDAADPEAAASELRQAFAAGERGVAPGG